MAAGSPPVCGQSRPTVIYEDEPAPGCVLPIRRGHVSAGRLERVLRDGAFAVTAELAPPDSANPDDVYRQAQCFDGYVDAINATDGSGGNCHMSSVGVCALLTRSGYSTIMQISCRDRNRIAIQGDILGAAAMGVANILCLTGDGVQAGDHPNAKPVFDLDCMSLLQTARTMRDQSQLLSGRTLSEAPGIFLGAAANPFAIPRDFRVERLEKKVAAGANFVQTQYCFDLPVFEKYMQRVRDKGLHRRVFILAGVGPLASARTARWIRGKCPRRAHSRRGDQPAGRRARPETRRNQALHRVDAATERDRGGCRRACHGVPAGAVRGRNGRGFGRAGCAHAVVSRTGCKPENQSKR